MNAAPPIDHQLYLDDFVVGESYPGPVRVLDDAAFAAFAALSGDAHPIHYDEAYAKLSKFGARVAHGLLVTSMAALGASPLSQRLANSMVAFLEQQMRYLRPVLIGDSVQPSFTVAGIEFKPGAPSGKIRFDVTLVNAAAETVANGYHRYLLATRPRA